MKTALYCLLFLFLLVGCGSPAELCVVASKRSYLPSGWRLETMIRDIPSAAVLPEMTVAYCGATFSDQTSLSGGGIHIQEFESESVARAAFELARDGAASTVDDGVQVPGVVIREYPIETRCEDLYAMLMTYKMNITSTMRIESYMYTLVAREGKYLVRLIMDDGDGPIKGKDIKRALEGILRGLR